MRAISPYVSGVSNMFEGVDNRRGFERRRFGSSSGIRIDRRSGQEKRHDERRSRPTSKAAERRSGAERRDLERRSGTDRRSGQSRRVT